MKQKITLIITGQLRLLENENPTDKIKYHIDYFKPNDTILFLWENEYLKYKNEINNLNTQNIILNHNLPIITEQHIQKCLQQINLQPNTITPITLTQDNKNFFIRLIKQYYQIQHTFQNVNETSQIYIKTRYDLHYLEPYNINPLMQFYNENKPIISTPFGGDLFGIGLGDLITITNNKANDIFKSYYDIFIQELQNEKCPVNAELLIRYIFKNLNNADIYRFNLFCTNQHMLQNNQIYHGINNIGNVIAKDNRTLNHYKNCTTNT